MPYPMITPLQGRIVPMNLIKKKLSYDKPHKNVFNSKKQSLEDCQFWMKEPTNKETRWKHTRSMERYHEKWRNNDKILTSYIRVGLDSTVLEKGILKALKIE